ncbi:hypothetical protein L873DRAFT_1206907 [Choiromyces venosus 120613-1]|uniref:Uncharacterized protein n=1 Tax=Choiromyces venosus 120613-1 TaxID=1336337 RepID=A0A3N4JJS2_9PEZI|nr:hypothetical protein L873DRAFT_1206907 [Choiromyces venosus 120613-1]
MKFGAISSTYEELADAHQTLTESSEKLAQIMGNVTEALGDVDEKVRSWEERISKLGHSAWLPVASFLLGGIILGRDWGRLNSILVIIIGGCFILLNNFQWSDLTCAQRFKMLLELWDHSTAISQEISYILSFVSALLLSVCCGAAYILYRRATPAEPLLG